MDLSAYVAEVRDRLAARGFAPLADLPPDLGGALLLGMAREERWGRVVLAVPPPEAATAQERREWLSTAVLAYCREAARRAAARPVYGVLAFLFPAGVPDGALPELLAVRQEDRGRRWGLIPWAVDLQVELVDRHHGFPQVGDDVQVALATPPAASARRGVAPQLGRRTGLQMLRDWRRGEFGPVPMTRLILAVTVAYYLWSVLMDPGGGGLISGPSYAGLTRWGGNLTSRTSAGEGWRLLGAMFLHGGLWHLGFNMWALWNLGRHVELLYGSRAMGLIYLLAGLSGSVATTVFRSHAVLSIGASGAVFGLLGAVAYIQRTTGARRIDWRAIGSPLLFVFLFGMFMNIDNLGHIGGLVGGFAAGWLVGATGHRHTWRRWAVWGALAVAAGLVAGVVHLPGPPG